MDKELMKAVFAGAGLPQMEYLVLRDAAAAGPAAVAAVESRLGYPVFVKPANLGSSVGMTKAHDRAELGPALDLAAVYDRKTVI
jgi:D-alanine-D-alanine ligase